MSKGTTTPYSVRDIISTIGKHKLLFFVVPLVCFLVSIGYHVFFAPVIYQSDTRIWISSLNDEKNLNDLSYTQKLVKTYVDVLQGNVFFNSVAEISDLPYTSDQLAKNIHISAIDNLELINIQVQTTNPEHSLLLAQTASELAQEKLKSFDVEVYHAPEQGVRVSPGIVFNGTMGILIGFCLSFIITTCIYLFRPGKAIKLPNSTLQIDYDMI